MDVSRSKIVWSGTNGCHMSQENVIKFGVALHPGPNLPIGYIGFSLWPQDPRGPPANCGTHRVQLPAGPVQ